MQNFNSRPHEEVDCNTGLQTPLYFPFQLTTSRGGRREFIVNHSTIIIFQLTTSRGGRPFLWFFTHENINYFNSRPHEEVDFLILMFCSYIIRISTHDLTRRSTSIRDIIICIFVYFNSRPHEEVDGLWPVCWNVFQIFQLTTSRGGRHDSLIFSNSADVFQLTTSRGGRRSRFHLPMAFPLHFNSRPHEEVDDDTIVIPIQRPIFQLTTSRGGRRNDLGRKPFIEIFQLTTSRGGRQQFHTTLRHLKLSFLCLFYIFEHFLLY